MEKVALSKEDNVWLELLRFLAVGLYGTLIDYIVEVWCTSLFSSWISGNSSHFVAFIIQFLISLIGFVIATPSTWSLSAIWAFKNKGDQKETKSIKGALKFTGFAFLGLLGGALIQLLGYMICLEWSGLNINILDINFSTLFNSSINVFLAFTIVFIFKTGFTTVFNYVTRKFILYKTKKQEN